jgi:hypothetical protein
VTDEFTLREALEAVDTARALILRACLMDPGDEREDLLVEAVAHLAVAVGKIAKT